MTGLEEGMAEIEDTLSRVLLTEADRHEPPVFDAHRIAEAAVSGKRFRRRPLLALLAAAIGMAGVGGAVALSAGGDRHRLADQVTVTFQSKTGTVSPQTTDASVKAWVRARAGAEGLKDVRATVLHSPWRLEVTGHAADLSALKTIGKPGILQIRPAVYAPGPQWTPESSCLISTVKADDIWRACDQNGKAQAAWIAAPVGISYRVLGVSAEQRADTARSSGGTSWALKFTFDSAGAQAFADFTARTAGPAALLVDGAVANDTLGAQPLASGWFDLPAGATAQQADRLAALLSTQGPPDLEGASVSVSTR